MQLEDEQYELLGKFVETHLSTPRESRGTFNATWPHNDQQATFFHSREQNLRFQGNWSDAEILVRAGLLLKSSGSSGSVTFSVLPEGINVHQKRKASFTPPYVVSDEPQTQPSHVFISYVHEDYEIIQKLSSSLQENGVRIWLDRNDIAPGARWKRVIKRAIGEGGFFLACFSPNYSSRSLTYMNEELTLAVDMLRKMPPDRCWFIPVLLTPCEVPDFEIHASETLRDIQQVHLYRDWEGGVRRILASVNSGGSSEVLTKPVDARLDDQPISVLFLAAAPAKLKELRLSEEMREIQGAIMGSQARNRFNLVVHLAVTPRSLVASILESEPQIIHFSGHGSSRGLVVEDETGNAAFVEAEALGKVIELLADKVECVVLNVADSSTFSRLIIPSVQYVISMNSTLSDSGAIAFSAGFYQALGNGRSIEEAFQFGCAQIALEGFAEESTPTLQSNRSKVERRRTSAVGADRRPTGF